MGVMFNTQFDIKVCTNKSKHSAGCVESWIISSYAYSANSYQRTCLQDLEVSVLCMGSAACCNNLSIMTAFRGCFSRLAGDCNEKHHIVKTR